MAEMLANMGAGNKGECERKQHAYAFHKIRRCPRERELISRIRFLSKTAAAHTRFDQALRLPEIAAAVHTRNTWHNCQLCALRKIWKARFVRLLSEHERDMRHPTLPPNSIPRRLCKPIDVDALI